ncbi:MAG: hypothetical protein IJ400_04815 [Clostridia bacterium]|nr:hypothetical protein [Clostridia bacterium]
MVNIPLTNRVNFYSQRLTGDFLRLYNASVENLARGALKTSVTFNSAVSKEMQGGFDAVIEAIIYGCPELFYIEQQVAISWIGNEITFAFSNKYGNESLEALWSRLDAEISRIAEIVKAIPRKFDKIHRINSYLCSRVSVNNSMVGRYGDAYGALILREARCEGFAKAAKLILDKVGFNSIIACGQALNGRYREAHAWNIISFNDQYYHFDFTWNSGRGQYGIPGQEYMFLDDSQAHVEHFPDHEYPCCTDATKTFWARNKGMVKYHSDLSRINIVPFKNNYMAIAKFSKPLCTENLDEEVFEWMRDELAASNYASQLNYGVNENLNLLIFYFINQ